jgi:putative membrane-bound dehydrogenase-like protein
MSRILLTCWLGSAIVLVVAPRLGRAQPTDDFNKPEFPARPAPAWVQMFDQKEVDQRLAGIITPAGIKVEIVAEEPAVVNPERLAFGDDGTLYALQWKPAELKAFRDRDGDSAFEAAETVMSDLGQASGILVHDGWIYWTGNGQVRRRCTHDADLLSQLQASAEAKRGPPTITTADGKWIEQTLVRGLGDKDPSPAGGLTLGIDGWLYVTAGSGDHRVQSWDGSKAAVLRTGAIFRMQPDGSKVTEFARGFCNPRGNIAIDELGNAFHLDDDLAGGGKFEGVRLLHLLEGADYGWRARDGDVQPDLARAAAWGERPGMLPGILKTGPGSPAGLLILSGTQFPDFLRGVLVYPDPDRRLVRGYVVERDLETFKISAQFDLMKSDDPLFRPCHAVQGPDGAIYIADRRSDGPGDNRVAEGGQQGRIYRLSWGGTDDQPAIPLAPLDSWQQIASGSEDQLAALLSSDEFELRRRAALELVRRARLDPAAAPGIAARATTIAYDDSRRTVVRAAALAVAGQLMDETAFEALLLMLDQGDADIQRLAAGALSEHPPRGEDARKRLLEAVQQKMFVQNPGVPYAMLLAHGKLAANLDNAEWAFEATSVSYRPYMGPQVFSAHVRALERTKDAARELLLGNLDVAVNFPDADRKEKERLKEFVATTAESMRSRELVVFLDALLRGKDDLLAKLDPPHQARLIAAYRYAQVDPPIHADAVAEWLDKHPGQPFEVELAALETLSLVGTMQPDATTKLADRLLAKPDQAKEIARRFLAGQIGESLRPRIFAALRTQIDADPTGEAKALLNKLAPNP